MSRTVPEFFEAQVARTPHATALRYKDVELTYRELNSRANRVARMLVERGVGPDRLVAVAVPRSPELVVALLAILKAGGAYLPLDPRFPMARKEFMVTDAAPVLLVRSTTADHVTGVELDSVVIDSDECTGECGGFSDADLAQDERLAPLSDQHLLYVIYTSGSTGTPKGVAVTHDGIADLFATQADRFGVAVGDRVLAWASISFDAGFWDIALALFHGGVLVLGDDEDMLPGDALHETLLKYEIDHAVLPPAALSITDSTGVLTGGTIMSTGDACTPALLRKWAPDRRMFNGYGPTEVTVGCTIAGPITESDDVGIGVPWTGARVHVLDDDLQPVPDGEEGELYLAGSGLARGYVNRPGLTATRFLPDPFGPPGSRMYRSGDRGRRGADGRFRFGGRADGQVKLRGFRVEPGEVEARLAQLSEVDLAVVVVEGELAGARLVACVTPRAGAVVDPVVVRARLAAGLPEFMVPDRIDVFDAFPVLANGKIDRSALAGRARAMTRPSPCDEPRSNEDRLCGSVARLLDLPEVRPEANFFEIGGNSLLAAQLISSLREELGVRVPIRAVLGARDLREIAESMSE